MSSFITCNANTPLGVKLITISYKFELLLWIAQRKALDNKVLGASLNLFGKAARRCHLTSRPPGPSIPPYISARAMNMLIKARTMSLYQPVWSRMSILILGLMPLGRSISIITPNVLSVNQKMALATVASYITASADPGMISVGKI